MLNLTHAPIILAGDAAAAERYAAEELQSHLAQITGTAPDIRSAAPDGPAILLGRAAAEALLPGFDWEPLQEDGVLVKRVGERLLLAGATPRGTLYAVYEFLDRELGCRWLTPSCSVIPQRDVIVVDEADYVYTPVFRYREPFFSCVWSDPEWAARNRVNGAFYPLEARHGGKWAYAGFVHTFYPLLPPEQYFDSHPEYYSEINGQRTYLTAQLCLSNPEVVDVMCDRIRELLTAQPETRIVSVSQNDWIGRCTCPSCTAIDEAEGSPSGTMVRFVNAVAERLEPEYPHVYFDTLAYTYTLQAPKTVRPRHNVIIRVCNITPCCDVHPLEGCEINRPFVDVVKDWERIAPEIFVWDYFNNFSYYFQPLPNLDAIAADIPFFAQHGVTGIFCQGDGTPPKGAGDMAELRAWLFARILWNPSRDTWAVVDEFLRHYYGPAAPIIREYLDLLHRPAREGQVHARLDTHFDTPVMAGDMLERCQAVLDRAEASVRDNPVLLDRVKAARLPLEYQAWGNSLRFAMHGDRYELSDPEMAARMTAFLNLAEAHGAQALRERGLPIVQFRQMAKGFALQTLDNGTLRAVVASGLGGRLMALEEDGVDWIHLGQPVQIDYPYSGGYEEYSEHQWRTPGWNEPYIVEAQSAEAVTLSATLENGLTLRRAYRLGTGNEANTLFLTSTLLNTGDERRQASLRTMPEYVVDFTDLAVRFLQADGSWRGVAPWQSRDAENGSQWETAAGAVAVECGGRRLDITFPAGQVEKILFDWDRSLHLIRLGLNAPARFLDSGESFVLEQAWRMR